MKAVNIHEAKTHLSRLLKRVARGDEVVIARAGVPVAKLVPWPGAESERVVGEDRGQVEIATDFDGPLPDRVLAEFER